MQVLAPAPAELVGSFEVEGVGGTLVPSGRSGTDAENVEGQNPPASYKTKPLRMWANL